MTIKELIKQLESYPDYYEVIVSKDSEGNGFSPLASIYEGLYIPETSWSGEFLYKDESDINEDSLCPSSPCVLIIPTN